MDHETAIQLQAAERYLLDQFSPEERRGFEEHFFGCPECADQVRAASILAANLKSVFREEPALEAVVEKPPGGRVRLLWPLMASAALNLVLVAGVAFQIYGTRNGGPGPVQAQFYRSFGVPAASRGDLAPFGVPAGSSFFGAKFDLKPDQHFDSFAYQILDASGAIRARRALKAPADAASELELAVPVDFLGTGEYQLVLYGMEQSKSVEISRARFVMHGETEKGR